MLFHTWLFLIYFCVVFAGHNLLLRTYPKAICAWLLLASYVFYAAAPNQSPIYLVFIVFSCLVDYGLVLAMRRGWWPRACLFASIVVNLSLLGSFKYLGFLIANLNSIATVCDIPYRLSSPIEAYGWALPVGISFYTFQSMSYTIDVYRGRLKPETNFIRFAAYVALFPQLVAGPIERARELIPQLENPPKPTVEDMTAGASLFVVGLFKKLALADYLGKIVNDAYANPANASGASLLLATVAFAWQIYFDFSGYSDMARGIARSLGFRLMVNFRNPYLATSMGDFWSRWHISLSTWFRDYVYIPLGGNRQGTTRTYCNLFLTMVLSGIWHGAAWTFVIWGILHAIASLCTREMEREEWYARIPRPIKQLTVFSWVCLTWVFFRAVSLNDACLILWKICTNSLSDPQFPIFAALAITSVWAYQYLHESGWRRYLQQSWLNVLLIAGMLLFLFLFVDDDQQKAFIYFQF